MKKCVDCDYFGGCEKSGKVCDKYKKTIHRTYTRLDKAENGIFTFKVMEARKDESKRY